MYARQYRQAPAKRKQERENSRQYRLAHPDQIQRYNAMYHAAHRSDRRKYMEQWNAEHRESQRHAAKMARAKMTEDERRAFSRRHRAGEKHRQWLAKNKERLRLKRANIDGRRRALKRNTQTERLNYQTLIERDQSICYLCHRVLLLADITLDHVIPLARGGGHTAKNLRVACLPCNQRKGKRLLSEMPGYQP